MLATKPKPLSHPTARDVAGLAGVSQAAVSYVLSGRRNGKDRISDDTRQRVMKAVAQLGYVPNQTARSLRRQQSERICLVVPALGVPYGDAMAQELSQAAERNGYSVVIAVGGTAVREREILHQLQRRLADGAVVVPSGAISEADLTPLVQAGLSIVVTSNHIAAQGFDVVRTNESDACYQAVQFLLNKDHRRIAFLGHSGSEPTRLERLDAYRRALHDSGLEVDERLIVGSGHSRKQAHVNALRLLQLDECPTAIFAASDVAAIAAMWAANSIGLRVPDDVAIIGVGNISEGEITSPPLTTIGPSSLEFTDIVQLLFSRLRGEASVEGRVVENQWQLIVRDSA